MKKYFCVNCGYIYDELMGDPERSIARCTLVSMLAEDWSCPDCGEGVERLCARSAFDYKEEIVKEMDR
ncbi:MAG: rubredoxin [Gammaproteobacteria bacterium]|nr:MAG: rubredoxin [Gammaproteobacteria bacterium]RLA24203.1 MAG: rubredoxin [Gammaproteobacteria bacterium]